MPANAPARISVIIPAYNQAQYLRAAVESAATQSLAPHEIIVVNDGSTDGTAALCRELGSAIHYWEEPHSGLGATRNKGFAVASGDFIAFLDADDIWEHDKLEKQRRYLHEHPDTDMVFGLCRQFISPELPAARQAALKGDGEIVNGIFAGCMLTTRAVIEKTGPFASHFQVGEFIDWFSRASDLGHTHAIIDSVVIHRRLHGENMSLRLKNHRTDYLTIIQSSLRRRRQEG